MRKNEKMFCNRCQKELRVRDGVVREGCFQVDYSFGYFSDKDGMRHRFDLCEKCYDEIIGSFQIPVEEVENTELM